MIRGIGCDIIEISRIKKAMENPRFLSENFSGAEREHFDKKRRPEESAAAAFAAKEAVAKALGTGFCGISPKDIEVRHGEMNKPYIVLCGRAAKLCKSENISISLSHCVEYAAAFAVIEE